MEELVEEAQLDYELVHDIQGRMILHWNYRNLRELPLEVLNFGEHIEEIYLKRNCLEKLPPSIGKLSNLSNLYLVGNQLEELPNEIGDLKTLRVLDISQNYIRRLPPTIGDLHLLESLLLTYNQLEELPLCLENLHRLKQLEVSGNRIYSLPQGIIQGLESLEELGIDRNPISSIPRNVCLLRNLCYFSACRCNLLLLPALPFHKLLQSAVSPRAHSSGSLPHPNKNLQFLFDGNPRLNYIPYWVFQLLGSNVECFGCGLDPGEGDNAGTNPHHSRGPSSQTQLQLYTYRSDVNRAKIKLNFKGKRRTLHFDEDLVKLHHCGFNEDNSSSGATVKVAVVSLLELCLRRVHTLGLLDEETRTKNLNAKPVVEPLIVPQRAGEALINIKGDLIKKEIGEGAAVLAATQESSIGESSKAMGSLSLVKMKTTVKSDDDEILDESDVGGCSNSHHPDVRSGQVDDDETGSATEMETNETEKVHCRYTDNELLLSRLLPTNLKRLLKAGPVARCFECLTPIFTESWPVVFHMSWNFEEDRGRVRQREGNENENLIRGDWDDVQEDGKLSVGCTHFCSGSCQLHFRSGTRFSSNLLVNDLRIILENEIPWSWS